MNKLHLFSAQAQKQAGLITRRQLMKAGLSNEAVKWALESGTLLPYQWGIYRLPGTPFTEQTRLWAALLRAGPNSYFSHRTAGQFFWKLDGLGRKLASPIELLTCGDWVAVKTPGLKIRRTQALKEGIDTTGRGGFPCTSLARTLVDLAAVIDEQSLEMAFDSAVRRTDEFDSKVFALLYRLGCKGRPGHAALMRVLTRNPTLKTGSPLEILVRDALIDAGIKPPLPQLLALDRDGEQIAIVDFAWPERQVAVFADSNRWHRSRNAWENDHLQRNALTAMQWQVLVITDRQLENHRDKFFDQLRTVLGVNRAARSGEFVGPHTQIPPILK